MKIKYAIIDCKEVKGSLHDNLVEIGINTSDIQTYTYEVDSTTTIAALKNQAIDDAKGYQYLFIIENDLKIKNLDIFRHYINLMNDYQLGVVFYGYYGCTNRVLHDLPNPAVKVRKSEFHAQQLVRVPSDTFIGIDLSKNTQKFNSEFQVWEFNEFLKRCYEYKVLPFQGFYFDVNNSWEYFDYIDGNPKPKISMTKETLEHDQKLVKDNEPKFTLVFDGNANQIMEYIKQLGE